LQIPEVTYETGILNMDFVERVNVFENYVDADQIADVDELGCRSNKRERIE